MLENKDSRTVRLRSLRCKIEKNKKYLFKIKMTISHDESKNFIVRELQKRSKINVVSFPDSSGAKQILLGSKEKQLIAYATSLSKIVKEYEKKYEKPFPLFFLLNSQYDDRGAKHATVIVITKNKVTYNISLFDPNGPIDVVNLKHDENNHIILTNLSIILNPHGEGEYVELMIMDEPKIKRYPINTLGGNCDALCLWFINTNKDSVNKTDIYEQFRKFYKILNTETKKQTPFIVKKIVELSKKNSPTKIVYDYFKK